jgi:hypothetical protein
MTVRGLLRVAPVLLALLTFATPAQADPTCVASAICVSSPPCDTVVCSDPSSMGACPTYLCVRALLTCDHIACINSPAPSGPGCSPVQFGDSIDEVAIDTSCLLGPSPTPASNAAPSWVFDLLPDLPDLP